MHDSPFTTDTRTRVQLLLSQHRLVDALAQIESVNAPDRTDELLLTRAQILLAMGRFSEAAAAFRMLLTRTPNIGTAELGLAVAIGTLGDAPSSEQAVRRAIKYGCDNAGSRYVLARSLFNQYRYGDAEREFEQALYYDHARSDALMGLVETIWQSSGDADHAFAALYTYPQARSVKTEIMKAKLVGMLHGRIAELSALERQVDASPTNISLRLAAVSAGVLCDPPSALRHAEVASRLEPTNRNVRLMYGDALLACGRVREADELATELRKIYPNDVRAIVLQATAWRLLGDERYRALYDYERFVKIQTIDAPPGWRSVREYLNDLTTNLRLAHRSKFCPISQTLRHGSQIELYPKYTESHPIAAFPSCVSSAIGTYARTVLASNNGSSLNAVNGYAISGIWSVLLGANGYHFNHYHPSGLISSACYIDISDSVGDQNGQGWIKFGEPLVPSAPHLEAEYFVKPKPGMLLLFPSWMWHGTVPFDGNPHATRLTIAFDVAAAHSDGASEGAPLAWPAPSAV